MIYCLTNKLISIRFTCPWESVLLILLLRPLLGCLKTTTENKLPHLINGVLPIKIKQITDGTYEECKSLVVRIVPAPSLKIIPRSQTLYKGDSLMIRCLTTNSNHNGLGVSEQAQRQRLGYIWTKNDKLLQSRLGIEYWEDLYPDGSLLVIKNIRKSATYKCVVSNTVAPISQDVYINVISGGINQTNVCHEEMEHQIQWPTSAPGPKVFVDCYPRFGKGHVERVCEQQDFERVRWLPPDFGHCMPKDLTFIRSKFVQMTHGYQNVNATYVLKLILQYVSNGQGLLTGQVSEEQV